MELMFNPVYPDKISDYDRTAYIEGVEDVIELDTPLVVAYRNLDVSVSSYQPTVIDTFYD